MDHTYIITAHDLDRYSDTRDSEAVIPELIYLLVKQSEPPPHVCRIPYGDAVNQPGWDGIVEIEESFLEFVPKGKSYWEIGAGRDPQNKATEDFKKRTKAITAAERSMASFVFVTPRSYAAGGWNEPEQTKWINNRQDSGWKRIHIIDGVKLADWLREFPAIGRWMAQKIGNTSSLGGITTPSEHWELIHSQGDKINHRIAKGTRYLARTQVSSRLFFRNMCSSISSDNTSFFVVNLASKTAIFLACCFSCTLCFGAKAEAPCSKNTEGPLVEHRRVNPMGIAQI